MARNVEFKARVPDLKGIRAVATRLADGPAVVLHQVDTFFDARRGRVKLRRVWSDEGSGSGGRSGSGRRGSVELILYRREDEAGARLSRYQRLIPVDASPGDAAAGPASAASVEDAAELTASLLSGAMGVRGEVSKTRTLLLIGQTRVHLDEVEGLGEFVELEVVLKPDQSEASGRKVAESLMFALGLDPEWIEPLAYIDLLEQKRL